MLSGLQSVESRRGAGCAMSCTFWFGSNGRRDRNMLNPEVLWILTGRPNGPCFAQL
jgi:hypothetical protein